MSPAEHPTSCQVVGAYVANARPHDIPAEVISFSKLCLLDTIGCGLYGSTLPQASLVADILVAPASGAKAAVWGTSRRLSPPDAALVNGTAIHAFELDDLHPRSIVHPGSVVTSAAMAAAALAPDTSGLEFLTATTLGYEVAARVGSTMGAAHLLAGWHPTGTHGTLGAAAAAGSVLGLDADALSNALGAAGSQAAGLMAAQYESMVKRLHAGRAAQSGVYAALLGRAGYVGIRDLFEADYGGYLRTFSPRADPAELTDGLGSRWESLAVGFKPYSANGSCHPTIDCLRSLYLEGLRAGDVERIDVHVSTATVKHVGWRYAPSTVTTAQMNLPYICAAVLNDGEAFIDQFTDERIRAPELVEFSSRVHVLADPEVDAQGDTARHKTRLVITLRDGRLLRTARDHAHGSSRDPMTEDEVRQKFRRLAASVLASDDVDELERVVDHLDTAQDLSGLVRLLGAVNPEHG